ncbi:hypothetical protein EDB89DRAFT_482130 [Lactarius sanguifluus]|nr:hypothetical protein EDB89DRAFT_482130 [Lactarius sanguifluus]
MSVCVLKKAGARCYATRCKYLVGVPRVDSESSSIRISPAYLIPQWHTTMTLIVRNSEKRILASGTPCGSRTQENGALLLGLAMSVSFAKADFTAYSMLYSRPKIHPMKFSVYRRIMNHFGSVCQIISIVGPSHNAFYSYGVTMISGGFGVLAATTMGSAEVSFSCTRKRGAVLSFPVIARREDTVSQDHFRKWIIRHIDSWLAFTQVHGLGIEMEDIILVTGCHHTRSWTNIAFNEVQAGAQLSLKVDVADALGANVNWGVSNVRIHGTVHNQGPSGENLPENQCIFVRGFRVKRTLKTFPRVKGAAEPTLDPSGSDDEPETEVVSIPSLTKHRDPLHVLLEYIAERAPHCDLVLVHDDDLGRILGAGDGTVSSGHI